MQQQQHQEQQQGDQPEAPIPVQAAVSIKVSPFFRSQPSIWFAQLEAQFALHRTPAAHRYYNCLANLPEDVASVVELHGDIDYVQLKTQVLRAFGKSAAAKLSEALGAFELGDQRPSVAAIRLRRSFVEAGLEPQERVLKHKLISALPSQVQAALAAHEHLALEEFLEIADAVVDRVGVTSACCAVKSANVVDSQERDERPPLGLQPFRKGQRPVVCRSHLFYGAQARSCKSWCQWPGPRPARMEPSSRAQSPVARRRSPSPARISGNE
jgi:hypothetical protein